MEFNEASNTFERKSTKSKDEVTVGGAASCQVSVHDKRVKLSTGLREISQCLEKASTGFQIF